MRHCDLFAKSESERRSRRAGGGRKSLILVADVRCFSLKWIIKSEKTARIMWFSQSYERLTCVVVGGFPKLMVIDFFLGSWGRL